MVSRVNSPTSSWAVYPSRTQVPAKLAVFVEFLKGLDLGAVYTPEAARGWRRTDGFLTPAGRAAQSSASISLLGWRFSMDHLSKRRGAENAVRELAVGQRGEQRHHRAQMQAQQQRQQPAFRGRATAPARSRW